MKENHHLPIGATGQKCIEYADGKQGGFLLIPDQSKLTFGHFLNAGLKLMSLDDIAHGKGTFTYIVTQHSISKMWEFAAFKSLSTLELFSKHQNLANIQQALTDKNNQVMYAGEMKVSHHSRRIHYNFLSGTYMQERMQDDMLHDHTLLQSKYILPFEDLLKNVFGFTGALHYDPTMRTYITSKVISSEELNILAKIGVKAYLIPTTKLCNMLRRDMTITYTPQAFNMHLRVAVNIARFINKALKYKSDEEVKSIVMEDPSKYQDFYRFLEGYKKHQVFLKELGTAKYPDVTKSQLGGRKILRKKTHKKKHKSKKRKTKRSLIQN